LLFAVALIWALSAIAGLFVCPKCGYENDENATQCIHCKAEFPAHAAAAETVKQPDDTPAVPKDNSWYLPAEIVEKEIKLARDNVEAGDLVVARLFFKNAMALDRITNPTIETKMPEIIRQAVQECDTAFCRVTGKCPLCKGTGNKIMQTVNMQGQAVFQDVLGNSCPMCKGRKFVYKYPDQDELKPALGAGAKRYTMIQQGRKYVTVGGAWIPMNLEDKLSIKQVALVKGASASSCDGCLGFCSVACSTCNGVGKIKCPKCENGWVKNKPADDKNKKKLIGANTDTLVKCPDCKGSTLLSCTTCDGAGMVMCKRCNGTGESAACKTCDGKGLVPCKKCLGAGKLKDAVCPACRGEGVVLCSSCNGDGRR